MNHPVLWNLNWKFCERFDASFLHSDPDDAISIHLPHTVKELPLNYFSHEATAMISTYMKTLVVEPEQMGRRLVLVFDGVMAFFRLYVNGELAGEHKGGYSKSLFDITDFCREGENRIVVMVDSHEREDIPPFGYAIDYMTYGGIYRDVWLYVCEKSFMEHVVARYELHEGCAMLKPEIIIQNSKTPYEAMIEVIISGSDGKKHHSYSRRLQVKEGRHSYEPEEEQVSGLILWNPDQPVLYTITVVLKDESGQTADSHTVKTGFRTIRCTTEGVFVNGKKIKIMGLNRHQSYPYVGYAMGKRAQEADAHILKEFGANTVRTSHYMQSEYFLDRCDEIGLLVFSEIPGWGHIGGEEFKQVMMQDVKSMILTQYHHPSIFIWSIHINESLDDDVLYEKANALARKLDCSRPTTGVRYIVKSHLLEDVYSMNDFTYSNCDPNGTKLFKGQREATGLTYDVPFMITEFSGTAFPTKCFDAADKRTEHARAYARVFSHANLSRDLLGIIGWCAFDYNTHGDYGSGDKICYHGVMDMFRVPKYAAYVLRSQKDPEEEIVMEPTTAFSRGDNKGNKLAAPFMVLTNCDYVEVEMYGKAPVRYFPDNRYMGLAHPPVEIEEEIGCWQDCWQDGRIVGYYQGKAVAEKRFLRDSYLTDMEVTADDTELYGDYVDTCRIVCRFTDEARTTLCYLPGAVEVITEGCLEVVGPEVVPVIGGYASFWVKTVPQKDYREGRESCGASVRIRPMSMGLDEKRVMFDIKKSEMCVR